MPTENGSVGKEDRCVSTLRDLMLDETGSNYVVVAILSYVSSNCEKNEAEPSNGDEYLNAAVTG